MTGASIGQNCLPRSNRTNQPTYSPPYHTTQYLLWNTERADKFGGFITIMPNGTMDPKRGGRFWDARACCNHDRLPVDDDAYLSDLIEVRAWVMGWRGCFCDAMDGRGAPPATSIVDTCKPMNIFLKSTQLPTNRRPSRSSGSTPVTSTRWGTPMGG